LYLRVWKTAPKGTIEEEEGGKEKEEKE